MAFLKEFGETGKCRMKAHIFIYFSYRVPVDCQAKPVLVVLLIRKRNDRIDAVIAAGQLNDNQHPTIRSLSIRHFGSCKNIRHPLIEANAGCRTSSNPAAAKKASKKKKASSSSKKKTAAAKKKKAGGAAAARRKRPAAGGGRGAGAGNAKKKKKTAKKKKKKGTERQRIAAMALPLPLL